MTKKIDLTDIITNLEPGETIADYVEELADSMEAHAENALGVTDSKLAILALRRLAASV